MGGLTPLLLRCTALLIHHCLLLAGPDPLIPDPEPTLPLLPQSSKAAGPQNQSWVGWRRPKGQGRTTDVIRYGSADNVPDATTSMPSTSFMYFGRHVSRA